MKDISSVLKNADVDAAFFISKENIGYITGYYSEDAFCVVNSENVYLITDFRYTELAEQASNGEFEVITVNPRELMKTVRKLLLGVNAVGIEKHKMTVAQYELFTDNVCAEIKDIGDAMYAKRSIKTPDEIAILSEGAELTENTLSSVIDRVRPGVTELDIAAEIKYLFNRAGAGISFEPIVASGPNSAVPHAVPTARKLEKGDLLTIDFGCIWRGLCTDMTRTFAISEISDEKKKLYDTVHRAQMACVESVICGMLGREADKIAREIIDTAGYEGCFEHGLGHGVGVEIHESPTLNRLSETVLVPGMVFSIEPGVYLKNRFGARIEDMVLLGEEGVRNFYSFTKELITL